MPLLGIYPEKNIIQKDTCTLMFNSTPFTVARTGKQSRCPSTEEWIKKMCYIYTMEYYSATTRNKIVPFAGMSMDQEFIIQSEVSQKEKNKHCVLMQIRGI